MSTDDTQNGQPTSPPSGPTVEAPSVQVPAVGKVCTKCQRHLPLTAEWWHRNKHSEDQFHNECRECRTDGMRQRRKVQEERLALELANIEDRAIDLLADVSQKVDGVGSEVPHESELYEEIIALMGGPAGMARQWYANFLSSEPGQKVRTMMLSDLLKMSNRVSASGAARREYDEMDHDALMNILERVIGDKLANQRAATALEPPQADEIEVDIGDG